MKLLSLTLAAIPFLLTSSAFVRNPDGSVSASGLRLSKESLDLIAEYETGGRIYYERRLQKATWPGGASGVTVGMGYDLGYNTRAQIAEDWKHLPAQYVSQMQSVAGVKGAAARLALARCTGVTVSWPQAVEVFERSTVPRFSRDTLTAFPGLDRQHPHGQGALVSLVFNRGSSLTGERRSEMRDIRTSTSTNRFNQVPSALRRMKRIWLGKGLDGLLRRREAEARLVERGLQ